MGGGSQGHERPAGACRAFDVSQTCYRYRARRPGEDASIAD